MKEKIKKFVKELLITIGVVIIASNLISLYKSRSLPEIELENTLMQRLAIEDPKHYDNKPLLLHFWATWCPACRLELENIEYISQKYNVVTVAVKSEEDHNIAAFMIKNGVTFKVINDKDGSLAELFGVAAYPTTFIYDKRRAVAFSEVGYTSMIGLWLRMWWANRDF